MTTHDTEDGRRTRAPGPGSGAIPRAAHLIGRLVEDSWRCRPGRRPTPRVPRPEDHAAAIDWLCLTHDVTGRRGCSKGFSLLSGWLPAFPETTGYIIGTLLAHGRGTGRADLVERAQQMGDWELEIQAADGGIMQGLVTERAPKSIVFNTGMVLHGWLDLHEHEPDHRYLDAARQAGEFLVRNQSEDGAWRGPCSYFGIPHTYHSRVSWALLRLGGVTGDEHFIETAMRNLSWVLAQQRDGGWFDNCNFRPDAPPNTHGMAYTLRGLAEAFALSGHDRSLEGARRTSTPLMSALDRIGTLPAVFTPSWTPAVRYVSVTGLVQLGGVWLRMYQLTGDEAFLATGLKAVEQAAGHQERGSWAPVRGAIPGSFPLWGRYAPMQFPNWPTKFLADAFALRAEVLAGASPERHQQGWTP